MYTDRRYYNFSKTSIAQRLPRPWWVPITKDQQDQIALTRRSYSAETYMNACNTEGEPVEIQTFFPASCMHVNWLFKLSHAKNENDCPAAEELRQKGALEKRWWETAFLYRLIIVNRNHRAVLYSCSNRLCESHHGPQNNFPRCCSLQTIVRLSSKGWWVPAETHVNSKPPHAHHSSIPTSSQFPSNSKFPDKQDQLSCPEKKGPRQGHGPTHSNNY